MALDRIDHAIVDALQNNARLSNKQLAATVGLAPSSCLERVRALTRAGVLKGFHTQVDRAALGIGLEALVAIRMTRHSRAAFRALYTYILALPEAVSVYNVSGQHDLEVHVAVRDVQHLRDLIVEKLTTRGEIDHCETSVIYDAHHKHRLPCYAEPPSPPGKKRARR
jgi:DNA-binding Lrp family transcriptional regulator